MFEQVVVAAVQVGIVVGRASVAKFLSEKNLGVTAVSVVVPATVSANFTLPVFQAAGSSGLLLPGAQAAFRVIGIGDLTK